MSGTELIYPDPIAVAYEIKDKIRDNLGFTVNVGIGRNKLCAKMASDFEKPDKVHNLFPEEISEKMWPLPVADLLFIGKSTAEKLISKQIKTIGDLARCDINYLSSFLGDKKSIQAVNNAKGIDDSPVRGTPEEPKGYSNEVTLEDDVETMERAEQILLALSDSVTAHMRKDNVQARCIAVKIR